MAEVAAVADSARLTPRRYEAVEAAADRHSRAEARSARSSPNVE